eukprot:scaffold12428_cov36-Cyclotella_meneghiniana.AAC.1
MTIGVDSILLRNAGRDCLVHNVCSSGCDSRENEVRVQIDEGGNEESLFNRMNAGITLAKIRLKRTLCERPYW